MTLTCYRRRGYDTERAALAIVYRIRARDSGAQLAVEKCSHCGKWHIHAAKPIGSHA